jgi:hypothetical protein
VPEGPHVPARPRKPYARPEMVVYGDLTRITQAILVAGTKDDGGGNGMKTT